MRICDYLKEDSVKINFAASDRDSLIKDLINLIPGLNKDDVYKAVLEREKLGTTGIGRGLAIPHARISNCDSIKVALIVLKDPVDFSSIDDKPVKMAILILTPKDEVQLQLRFLARVSRLLRQNDLVEKMIKAKKEESLVAILKEYEEKHFH